MDKEIARLKRDNAELQEQVLILIQKTEKQEKILNKITDIVTLFRYEEGFKKIIEIIKE